MKHTLNVLTLTALAAAASAQTAPASGLNYNQLTFSRASRQNTLGVQLALGESNFVAGFATTDSNVGSYNYSQVSVGYVFKGVTQGIDATIGVIQGSDEYTVYSIQLRRQLNEVYQGLEIAAGYAGTLSGQTGANFIFGGFGEYADSSANYVELVYNINKTFSVSAGLVQFSGTDRQHVWSLRANF